MLIKENILLLPDELKNRNCLWLIRKQKLIEKSAGC